MVKIAIVDDESAGREKIKECLSYVFTQKGIEYDVDEFESADGFLVRYEPIYDIIFMDIEFPKGDNGLEAARKLRKIDKSVILVFVTNMAHMALQGYEVDALDFIVKPVERGVFALKMERVIGRIKQATDDKVLLKTGGETVRIRTCLITYLEVDGHYINYHSKEGTFTEYISLSAAEKKLQSGVFVRCNRSVLVNFNYVDYMTKEFCYVEGEPLAIARPQRKVFMQAYADYLSGKLKRDKE